MFKRISFIAVAATLALAGCVATDAERTVAGAAIGAGLASATHNDVAVGALVGAGVAATCPRYTTVC